MMMALSDVLGISKVDLKRQSHVDFYGPETGNGNGRALLEEDLESNGSNKKDDLVKRQSDRELQTCYGNSRTCTAWWCCMVCGWNCRRRELVADAAVVLRGRQAALNQLSKSSSTAGASTEHDRELEAVDDLKDTICNIVQALVMDKKGTGCLKDATLTYCEYDSN